MSHAEPRFRRPRFSDDDRAILIELITSHFQNRLPEGELSPESTKLFKIWFRLLRGDPGGPGYPSPLTRESAMEWVNVWKKHHPSKIRLERE